MSERVESSGTRLSYGAGNFNETTTIINDNASNNCDDSNGSNISIIIINNNSDNNYDPYSLNFYFLKSNCIIKKFIRFYSLKFN